MEQNKNQSNQQSANRKSTNQQGNAQGIDSQQMQHRNDAVDNNTQKGTNNPQDGSDWSNYRNRSLSSNTENQQQK